MIGWEMPDERSPRAALMSPDVACPGCRQPMVHEDREGVPLDRCPHCESLWFDATELDRVLGVRDGDEAGLEARIPERGSSARRCPRCHTSLETAGWPQLVLDRCARCRGLF